jgi:hypothetical protein
MGRAVQGPAVLPVLPAAANCAAAVVHHLAHSETTGCFILLIPPGGGRATAQQLVAACQGLLGRLQAAGYICSYQLTWGGLPGGWPADWASEPGLQGDPVEAEAPPAAYPFQVSG